jgi:hypothetical protein
VIIISTNVVTAEPSVVTTWSTTYIITTTNAAGSTITSAPDYVTTTFTTTNGSGVVITQTEVAKNQPTLASNDHSATNPFFKNTGAVAGVFAVVGLGAAAIVLWLIFFIRRRRRTRRLEHDTAVSATLAAAGFNRSPLHDDEDSSTGPRGRSPGSSSRLDMAQRRSDSQLGFMPPSMRHRQPSGTFPPYTDPFATPHMHDDFNPYVMPGATATFSSAGREGYVPAPTSSPPPSAGLPPSAYRDATARTDRSSSSHGHAPSGSQGSYEPLLGAAGLGAAAATAAANRNSGGTHSPSPQMSDARLSPAESAGNKPGYFPASSPPIPPRSPMRTAPPGSAGTGGLGSSTNSGGLRRRASSVYSNDEDAEDDVGTVHELPETRARLEVRNADGTLSRASSVSHSQA